MPQRAGPPPPPRDKYTARVEPIMTRLEKFWQRVTDGMRLNELWKQFRAEARSSYQLYSREVDSTWTPGVGRGKHFFNVAGQFFWAIILKLTPARRVLLLIALVFLFSNVESSWQGSSGNVSAFYFGSSFWGGLLMLVLAPFSHHTAQAMWKPAKLEAKAVFARQGLVTDPGGRAGGFAFDLWERRSAHTAPRG